MAGSASAFIIRLCVYLLWAKKFNIDEDLIIKFNSLSKCIKGIMVVIKKDLSQTRI